MKRTVTYMLCLLPLLLAACQRSPELPLPMQRAEALMQPHPDSALAILASMTPPPTAQRFQFEAWKVLLVQARDRNYLPIIPYERAIRRSVVYFDSIATDATSLRAKAHYYLGRIYQDKGDDVNTVREFLTAEPLAEEAKDTTMMINAKSNMGFVFWNNNLLEESDSLYRKLIPLEIAKRDTSGLVISYTKLADIYIQKEKPNYQAAKRLLLISLYLSKLLKDINIEDHTLASLCFIHFETKEYRKSIDYAERGLKFTKDPYGYYLTLGATYSAMNKNDSAYYYLNKCIASPNKSLLADAYKTLEEVALKEGNTALALVYKNKREKYGDYSVREIRLSQIDSEIKGLISARDNSRLKIHTENSVYQIIIAASIILLISFCIYKILLKHKQNEIRQLENESSNSKKNENFLSEKIDEKNTEIKRLRSQQSREDFKSLPAYRRMVALRDSNRKEDGRQKLEATDWEEIETEVNSIIPHFAARLTKAYPKMTSSDIEFCIVSLFGFSFNDIPYVLGISFQALYKRKNAILSHTGLESLAQLEEYLTHLDEADCPKTQD
jgi:hypothetical protein